MAALIEFLPGLLFEGRVILRSRPTPTCASHRQQAIDLLERAFADYRLEVAGPLLDFDAATALAAAELLRETCWFLVNHEEPDAELQRRLVMPALPAAPAQHLSADLVLRFLPQLHRRARSLNPGDLLPALLARVLRQWPLTGVLADVEEGPLTPPEFGEHPGLLLMYAERLAQNEKAAWVPQGKGWEYVELVGGKAACRLAPSARR